MRDAIHYMRQHAGERLTSARISQAVDMSPSRFEHAFTEWVGISPKRYLAHLIKQKAKSILVSKDVLKTAHAAGLSGPGRLHGLMVTHEAVSPGEFKTGEIDVSYGVHDSPFGKCLIGITKRGVCHLSFLDENELQAERQLKDYWPKAHLVQDQEATAEYIRKIFKPTKTDSKRPIHLLIKGTNFQVKVWEALLAIPEGRVSNYSEIAKAAGSPKAVRAAGTACGNNLIGFLIPCHRVLTSSGGIGGYRWGVSRKETILAWESIRMQSL